MLARERRYRLDELVGSRVVRIHATADSSAVPSITTYAQKSSRPTYSDALASRARFLALARSAVTEIRIVPSVVDRVHDVRQLRPAVST